MMFFLISCGSKKIVTADGDIIEDASASSIVKKHYEEEIDFKMIQARLRVRYEDEGTTQNLSVSLRMEKDEVIWLSGSMLGITLAKVMITPTRVRYYEKIEGTYFDGDFELLSNWLGIPLDFEKVQNLLIGQALYDLRKEKWSTETSTQGYRLSPLKEYNNLERNFLITPETFKILAEQISQPNKNRYVTITYPEYQMLAGKLFPSEIKIMATDMEASSKIEIEFIDVDLNADVNFPFEIPSGYDEITIE